MAVKPQQTTMRSVLEVGADGAFWRQDEVASEWPITLRLNGEELVTIVATPEYLQELAVGYLASEGLISSYDQVLSLEVREETLDMDVAVAGVDVDKARAGLFARRTIASCCGKGRATLYFTGDVATVKPVPAGDITLSRNDCLHLMEELQSSSTLYHRTGGLHNACLSDGRKPRVVRADIGRHNALDKIYGYCLMHGLPLGRYVLAFSGRVSSEILLKAAKLRTPVVISKAAPTELALAMAEDLGITVVGFVREERINVYTHPERLIL